MWGCMFHLLNLFTKFAHTGDGKTSCYKFPVEHGDGFSVSGSNVKANRSAKKLSSPHFRRDFSWTCCLDGILDNLIT